MTDDDNDNATKRKKNQKGHKRTWKDPHNDIRIRWQDKMQKKETKFMDRG